MDSNELRKAVEAQRAKNEAAAKAARSKRRLGSDFEGEKDEWIRERITSNPAHRYRAREASTLVVSYDPSIVQEGKSGKDLLEAEKAATVGFIATASVLDKEIAAKRLRDFH